MWPLGKRLVSIDSTKPSNDRETNKKMMNGVGNAIKWQCILLLRLKQVLGCNTTSCHIFSAYKRGKSQHTPTVSIQKLDRMHDKCLHARSTFSLETLER